MAEIDYITTHSFNNSHLSKRDVKGPDAEVVKLAQSFLAAEIERERRVERLFGRLEPWSKEEEAEWEANTAMASGYHLRMAAIAGAQVSTRTGLLAQASVMLWHAQNPSGEDVHLWNLASSVFRAMGEPLPAWVAEFAHGQKV